MSSATSPATGAAISPEFVQALRNLVGHDGVLVGDEVRSRPAGFFRADHLQADMLVRPRNTGQVAAVLRLCHEARQPVVAQGGRTGLVHSGDAAPSELILSMERMAAIEEIDPIQRIAVVQCGVTLQALQEAADEHDLAFPLDLGARGSCTLGGNVSTNAGGNRVIRYGMTRDMVLGLEAVLADGTVMSSMNRMLKNNAAYDLKQLFIGSEGTLGIVTRLVLRLREKPRSQDVALVGIGSFANLTAFLKHMDRGLGGALSAFEAMWDSFYKLVSTPPAKCSPPLPQTHPYYVLVEAQGADPERDNARFNAVLESALEQGLIADAAIAHSERERAGLWALRDSVLEMVRFGMPFLFDVSLPIPHMEAYVEEVHDTLRARWPEHHCWTFGHLGDGNLHFGIIVPGDAAETHPLVEQAVYEPLARIGGSVSAEHGIGLEKKPYLHLSRSGTEIGIMRTLKRTLDPHGILNPGKVF